MPLVVALSRGTGAISATAVSTFHIAESLAAGRGLPYVAAPGQPGIVSPLFTLGLYLMAEVGLHLPWTALVLGALAWSLTTLAVYDLGRRSDRPVAGALAALLVALSPGAAAPATLATHVPWALCLAWWAIWATVVARSRIQTVLILCLLAMRLDLATLATCVLLLAARAGRVGKWPWGTSVAMALVCGVWVVLVRLGLATPLVLSIGPGALAGRFLDLATVSEFYWFLPIFAVAGIVAGAREGIRVSGLIWLISLVLSHSVTSWSLFITLSASWAGLGIASLSAWVVKRRIIGLPPRFVLMGASLLGVLPLLLAQATLLFDMQVGANPEAQALVSDVSDWLRTETQPDETLLASTGVGYAARRPTLVYAGKNRDLAAMAQLQAIAEADPPAWCVSMRTLAWDDLLRTGWFRSTYFPVQAFSSAYVSSSPITVWKRRPTHFSLGDYSLLDVRLPDGRFWVGYRYGPDRIAAGDTVSVTLFAHEPQPVADAGTATVYLRPPGEGDSFAQQLAPVSRTVAIEDAAIGRVWAERFVLTAPADLAVGAYYLSASILERGSDRLAQIYQDDQVFPVNRVTLGYVVRPWSGDLADATRVGANLGNRATLVGYEAPETLPKGESVTVSLYWEARQDLGDFSTQHFAFVHLLDAAGDLVAQHDGPVAGGDYPMQAWVPGEVVPDRHTLLPDPALPSGDYRIQAGLYTWPTLERLPAWDQEGGALPDGVVVLGRVRVP